MTVTWYEPCEIPCLDNATAIAGPRRMDSRPSPACLGRVRHETCLQASSPRSFVVSGQLDVVLNAGRAARCSSKHDNQCGKIAFSAAAILNGTEKRPCPMRQFIREDGIVCLGGCARCLNLSTICEWQNSGLHFCRPLLSLDNSKPPDQRFENWKLRRALGLPYFLRSTVRGSRVRKPPGLSAARSVGS
jgi:hypothetical protein